MLKFRFCRPSTQYELAHSGKRRWGCFAQSMETAMARVTEIQANQMATMTACWSSTWFHQSALALVAVTPLATACAWPSNSKCCPAISSLPSQDRLSCCWAWESSSCLSFSFWKCLRATSWANSGLGCLFTSVSCSPQGATPCTTVSPRHRRLPLGGLRSNSTLLLVVSFRSMAFCRTTSVPHRAQFSGWTSAAFFSFYELFSRELLWSATCRFLFHQVSDSFRFSYWKMKELG